MAEAAISTVLSKLVELAVREAKLQLQVGDDIIMLRDKLEWLQASVRNADRERRAGTDGFTQVQLRQTRDVAFAAEDALDDFFHEEVVGQDCVRRWQKFYRYCTAFCMKLLVRHGLSGRLKMIKSRLDQISAHQKEYSIVHTPSVVLASSTTAIAAWRNDLEYAEGFDEHVITLMDMLNNEDRNTIKPMFISIVGESGAGKNTLAGIIHRLKWPSMNAIVRYNMEPGSSTEYLLKEVHRLASSQLRVPPLQEETSADDICDKLLHLLSNRHFLLILGGISSQTTLNCLRASLPDDRGYAQHVMLLLDTEIEEVGWQADAMNRPGISGVHTLARLDRARSGQLFFWKVHRKGQYSSSQAKKSIWREKHKKMLDARKLAREEETQASLMPKREEEVKQASVMQKIEEEGKQAEQQDEEEQAALKKRKEEQEKEEEELQAALNKSKAEVEKQFEEEEAALRQEIEEMEKQEAANRAVYAKLVHEITGGYPMAIVLLAGLLRFKEKPGQWNAVLEEMKHGNTGSTQDGGGEGLQDGQMPSNQQLCSCTTRVPSNQRRCSGTRRAIEVVFWASFEDLPNDLKSCLLYFAGYPSNFSHSADMIVRMWMAEGFIRRQKGKTMEEVGYDYLKELVLRCLVEVEEMKVHGGIKLVRIHRSLMGFLQSEVRESGFMEIDDTDEALVPSSVRRLSVQSNNGPRYTTTFAHKNRFPKLRSFQCHTIIDDQPQHYHALKFLLRSRFLRVISIHGLDITDLPDHIGDMIQLRYLRVDCKSLRCLPSSIAKLLNLQTLDITNTQVKEIDDNFWKIKTLRHVLASNLRLPAEMPVMEEGHCGGELQTLHGVKPTDPEHSSEGNTQVSSNPGLLTKKPAMEESLGGGEHEVKHPKPEHSSRENTQVQIKEGQGRDELKTQHGVKAAEHLSEGRTQVSVKEEGQAAHEVRNKGNCPLDKMTSLLSLEMHGLGENSNAVSAALGRMLLLEHLKLQGDEIPECVFTDPSLRSLQTMVLHGNVKWDEISKKYPVIRKVRPNLVQLTVDSDTVDRRTKDDLLEGIKVVEKKWIQEQQLVKDPEEEKNEEEEEKGGVARRKVWRRMLGQTGKGGASEKQEKEVDGGEKGKERKKKEEEKMEQEKKKEEDAKVNGEREKVKGKGKRIIIGEEEEEEEEE